MVVRTFSMCTISLLTLQTYYMCVIKQDGCFVNIKTPFGFKSITIGKITIYTGKLRFKGIKYEPGTKLIDVMYHRGYCIISYETTDIMIHNNLVNILGTLCKTIAQAKLDQRYGWVTT